MLSEEVIQTHSDDRLLIIDWASLGYQTMFGLLSEKKKMARGEGMDYDPVFRDRPLDLDTRSGTIEAYRNSHLSRVIDHILLFNPTHMLFALEGGKNWRYDLYSDYKAHRKFSEWPFVVSKKEFDHERVLLANELAKLLCAHAIKVLHAEGDDIIAGAVNMLQSQYKEIIVSTSDRDIVQLTKHNNVKIFDSKDRFFKSCEEGARFFVETKILQGDTSDNILGIQLPGKKRRLGPKTAAALYNACDGNVYDRASEEGWLDQYILNKSLIDMDEIPDVLMENIREEINTSSVSSVDYMELVSSNFTEHNIQKIAQLKSSKMQLFESNNGDKLIK